MSCAKSQLVSLLGRGDRIVAAMQAFIDESGTNPELPVLAVAGCYGDAEQWAAFLQQWEPLSGGFHAKKSSRLFSQLVAAMKKSQIRSLLVSVSKRKSNQSASSHFKTALGNAYASCALLCLAKICDFAKPHKVAVFFEGGQPNIDFVLRTATAMMDSGDWNISAVASAKKDGNIELQTADFVSHICSTYDRPWMEELFTAKLLGHIHVSPDDLRDIAPTTTRLFQLAKAVRKALKNSK